MKESVKLDYSGRTERVRVPDTLDLADNARRAIEGLAGTIDPGMHHQLFFHADFCCKPAYMNHYASDTTLDAKYGESFPMLRLMTGSDAHLDIENAQRAELLGRIDDGLYWNYYDENMPWRSLYRKGFDRVDLKESFSNVLATARMLRAILTWKDIDDNERWGREAEALIGGLKRIALHANGYSYYPDGGFGEPFNYPRSGWASTHEARSDIEGGEGSVVGYQGNQIQVLTKWYALTGDTGALEVARRITNYCMLPRFWGGVPSLERHGSEYVAGVASFLPDPICVAGSELGHWFSHFHMRSVALRGILEYALATNDWHKLQFVKRALEHAMTMAIPRLGWYNCYPGAVNLMEGCALGDLIAMFVKLSEAGAGDYWDDLDALVRNSLVEAQLSDKAQMEAIVSASEPYKPQSDDYSRMVPSQYTEDRVIERTCGNFASQFMPGSVPKLWVMQCCTANATEGLYYAWEAIVREKGRAATVNLLLNRASRGVTVMSSLPYEGKAEVAINEGIDTLTVRVPGWTNRKTVRTHVNGKPAEGLQAGQCRTFTGLRAGDRVVLSFDLPEDTQSYTVNKGTDQEKLVTCKFRGSTAVEVLPDDAHPQSYRMYRREHMKGRTRAGTVDAVLHVPDRLITDW